MNVVSLWRMSMLPMWPQARHRWSIMPFLAWIDCNTRHTRCYKTRLVPWYVQWLPALHSSNKPVPHPPSNLFTKSLAFRALCRIKLLPVTHVLVDTWILTVKLVYKLPNVPDDLKWATNTRHHLHSLSRYN